MPNISIKTFEVWNIERAGYGNSTIELITIFNVDDIHSNVSYQIFNSKNERIYNVKNRFYNKGEPLYPKISPQSAPKGEITIVAWLVNNLNEKISDFATKVLYLKNAVPASGIGQAAQVPLPEFPEATREATITAQSPTAIAEKVHREREEAYVSPIEARAQLAQEAITEPAPVIVTEPILPEISILPEVYAEPAPVMNDQVTTNMIRQELLNFTLANNRIQGSIKFIATGAFNPYYYNKEIINYLQLKSNDKIILIKTNRLRFTETERDEVINFDEHAFNLDSINAESYVWTGADLAMSNTLQFTIEAGKEPTVAGKAGFMGAGVLGLIGILMLGGFIADHVRKRK